MADKKKTTSVRSASSRKSASASSGRSLTPLPAREPKPVIGLGTWITVLVLAIAIGFAFFFNKQKASQAAQATSTPGSSLLFGSENGTVSGIKIESSTGASVEVIRDVKGTWVLKAPTETAADQAQAEAAATQVAALRVLGDVQLGLDIVGLDKPSYTITITFTGGKTSKLLIGSVTPIQTGYYVQLDGGKTQIVDNQGIDALLGMLTNPPYAATPTPLESATPTAPTPTSTPDLTLTPATAAPPVTVTATP